MLTLMDGEHRCLACSSLAHSAMFGRVTSENYVTKKGGISYLDQISSAACLGAERALFQDTRSSFAYRVSRWTALSCAFLRCSLCQAVSLVIVP